MSNPGNIIGGHKANLNNPNTSDESKQHSKDVLNQEFDGDNIEHHSNQNKNPGNVTGGLKATLNNPNVSDEAKQSAKDRLNDM
ncbi:putative conidiation-specific protein 6 protein [Botryosphaeria dothidea]|uniref:Putative conidiation-specific protein 6 protein n=1 Tax=Botryosphaeria dothidea TaxID=55169 RepID=A0A8H4IGP4_9PEZI|nr:putative conidiation-specific protein 6 protein [Botryosphaeria dothidea]KAF4305800.1 putative conidiation-specific protein 6 protein [Botryosphaeria dothidea]